MSDVAGKKAPSRPKGQIQYKGGSFWTSSNKVKTTSSSMFNFYNQKNHWNIFKCLFFKKINFIKKIHGSYA